MTSATWRMQTAADNLNFSVHSWNTPIKIAPQANILLTNQLHKQAGSAVGRPRCNQNRLTCEECASWLPPPAMG